MTFDEMKDHANRVVEALRKGDGITDVELLEEDLTPGQPLPIAFVAHDGAELVVALDVL